MNTWKLYIIHFEQCYHHARHYIGIAQNVEKRIKQHKAGRGSKLMKRVYRQEIAVVIVILDEFFTYSLAHAEEKRRKNMGGGARNCPICKLRKKNKEVSSWTNQNR